jgi:hypothetical protein
MIVKEDKCVASRIIKIELGGLEFLFSVLSTFLQTTEHYYSPDIDSSLR